MRKLLLLITLIGATAQASTGQERAQAAGGSLIGQPAPRLVLQTIDGRSIHLGVLYGKQAVYLKFWATWCVPCREQMPHFERSFERAGPHLAVIAVNAGFNDSLEDVRSYRQTLGLKMPIVIDDGRLAAALNLRVTPQHVVIGRDGRVLYVGHLVDARLEQALATAVGTAPVSAKNVPAVRGEPALGVGDRLPPLSVPGVDGKAVSLRDSGHRGPTVLVFLWPSCESYLADKRPERSAACRAVREQIEVLAAAGGPTRWLGISSALWASREDLIEYQTERKISIPLVLDESGALFRKFGVTTVPTLIVIDADGRIVGRRSDAGEELRRELERLPAT